MIQADDSSCVVCKKLFHPVLNRKRQCKTCFSIICKDCSPDKIQINNRKERICEPCFQKSLQKKLFTSSNYDVIQLMFERDLKLQSLNEWDEKIKTLQEKITNTENDLFTFEDIKNKKITEFEEKQKKIENDIKLMQESINNYKYMLACMKEKKNNKKKELEEINETMMQINEESRRLDDNINESENYVKDAKVENEFFQNVISEGISGYKIASARLEKKINKRHRKTQNVLDSLTYNNALMKARIGELKKLLDEKKNRLKEIRSEYMNYQT
ncbi:hypothetical protein SteCoe_34865 [Stentor coeruleus]|uniref:FYVE-type domain-containing protein n=1 Tax=Stentor coeruleus TaxID=5963 RepID=A0A1R2ATL0_9CILI|nr:hypothetical protein SteCoe_34865 [Stentor coeruleus]